MSTKGTWTFHVTYENWCIEVRTH